MECYTAEGVSFKYPTQSENALSQVSFSIGRGEFVLLCGRSGCGKSTLLRQLKPAIAPCGERSGKLLFSGKDVFTLGDREQCEKIGFVFQSPENQIVTDKVWHELAFGMESLGYSTPEIRARVSEMASFFGIQTWFHKKVAELSGGQKQLLNLASVMTMQPEVLILDEPTSQLDPIAARDFLETVFRINRELGTTVILSEQRLEEVFPMADRVIVMDGGRVLANGTPQEAARALLSVNHAMSAALPAPVRVYAAVENGLNYPLTVRGGREWLERFSKEREINNDAVPRPQESSTAAAAVELSGVRFRYEKEQPDVIKELSMTVLRGELYAIVGGNGTGKTTALSLISGLLKPYAGSVKLEGQPLCKIQNKYNGLLGVLPQNPQSLFVKKTVEADLYEMLEGSGLGKEEQTMRVRKVAMLCELSGLLSRHPYDLSGGERQRAALAKVLLLNPRILLMDEPTKGMDACFKESFADILYSLKSRGVTVIMVSHDIEFCAEYADRCAMFFDGAIVSEGSPREFFAGKSFYTTSANRMARSHLPAAVLAEDIILACGGSVRERERSFSDGECLFDEKITSEEQRLEKRLTAKRIAAGCFFGALLVLTMILFYNKLTGWQSIVFQAATLAEAALCVGSFIPEKERVIPDARQSPPDKRKLPKKTAACMLMSLAAAALTVFVGYYYLGDRKYYFISLLIIIETLVPFLIMFERRKIRARELVIISVLIALAVAGRAAFYMLPQFKPVLAVVIISGVCFGGETGFLVGAAAAFVSNFFFGQGPWTPWQMFATGFIGFLAGLLFRKGILSKSKGSLAVFGFIVSIIVYGGIMNFSSVAVFQDTITAPMLASAYAMGLPFDLITAASTVFFLWFISEPMLEKLDRVKIKYGLLE